MRIAALYDIHGNLPALQAALQAVRDSGVDQMVVGGDVLPGPQPRETLQLLQQVDLPAHFIQGNGEREVLALLAGEETPGVPEAYRPSMEWVGRQLDDRQLDWIATWPTSLQLDVRDCGAVLFCHATPRSDTEIVTRTTPDDRLLPALETVSSRLIVCGHTHMSFDRRVGPYRLVNAGSVGMPFGKPGAHWLLLGAEPELRHTVYDLEAAARQIEATDYPLAADFACDYVLHPPAEDKMLAMFERAAKGP